MILNQILISIQHTPFDDMFLGPKPSITMKTASATLHTLVNGSITGYTITDGGSGYMETIFVPQSE